MKILYAALVAAGVTCAGTVQARPVIIEQTATLPAPPGGYFEYGRNVAIDGDYALITARRQDPVDPGGFELYAALLYRRTSAGWVYDSTLAEEPYYSDIAYSPSVAMRDGVAAVNFAGIFRRTATGWVREADSGGRGPDIEYNNGRFVFGTGEGDWGAVVAERDSGGTWRHTRIQGPPRPGDNDNNGGPLDIDGNTIAIAANDVPEGATGGPHLYRFTPGTGWHFHSRPPFVADTFYGPQLALRGNELFVDSALARDGTYLFRDEWPGGDDWNADWQYRGRLQTTDSYMSLISGSALEKGSGFVFQYRYSGDLGGWVYHVFGADEEGHYHHVATLVSSDRNTLGGHLDISGRRVIVASAGYDPDTGYRNTVRIFDLPEEGPYTTSVLWDRYFTNSPSNYSHQGGDWRLATVGNTTVFRQHSVSGDARVMRLASERGDGAIQVDVRPRAFNGNDRWFGVISRFTNAQNYYYVTMRSSNRVELRRMSGGVFTTLVSQPFPVTLGRNYRLRLESVGAYHRVFVDDRLILGTHDATHSSGSMGLMTSRASADFDNLYITPNHQSTIYSNYFIQGDPVGPWKNTGPGAWNEVSNGFYAQSSVAGDARAIIGAASAEDQTITVRARATAFAVPSGSQARWFGALLRYVDDANYAYVSLRNTNQISLRQLVNGQINVLTEAPFTVTPGTWYTLRVEAGLFSTNVYVNGELVLEGPPLRSRMAPRGQVGLVTYKAAADFDDFFAYQP